MTHRNLSAAAARREDANQSRPAIPPTPDLGETATDLGPGGPEGGGDSAASRGHQGTRAACTPLTKELTQGFQQSTIYVAEDGRWVS
jgi:hypothetical protein